MIEWHLTQSLVGLPGMPGTPQGVRKMAKKNLWRKRPIVRSDKRGCVPFAYYLFDLPRITQQYIAQNQHRFGSCAEPFQGVPPSSSLAAASQAVEGLSGATKPCKSFLAGHEAPALPGAVVANHPVAAATGTFLENKVGMMMTHVQDENRDARFEEAARRLRMIEPLLKLPPRFPNRRALAEGIARDNAVSAATLYRWIEDYRKGGLPALGDKHRADLGQARVLVSAEFERIMTGLGLKREQIIEAAEWLMQLVRALWAAGGTSPKQIWNEAIAKLGLNLMEAGLDEISARAVGHITQPRRFVEAEKKYKLVATANRNAKAIYDNHLPEVARTRAGLRPGDLVFGDISPLDIPTLRPDGSVAYARMIVWMDAATNWLHITLYLCPPGTGVRQEHVAQSFSNLCHGSPFGMPLRLYLDNGSEYQWEEMLSAWSELAYLTGNQTHVELANALPASGKIIRSIPFRPRAKLIESAFGNLRHLFGWHPAFQGGNRMAKRCANLGEAIKPIPYDELQTFLAAAMADYHATPQSGQLGGKSPQQALDAALDSDWKPVRVDKEVLLLAFAEQDKRSVKAGIIQYAGQEWYADFLVGLHQKVDVRYPKHDPQCLFVFDQGRFLGVALPQPKYGILDPAGAKEAGRRRGVLRDAIDNMAGQVQTLQVHDVIGSRGKLMGVNETVNRANQAALPVTLSDEAKALIEAKKKAEMEESARTALINAARKQERDKIVRWNLPKDPEEAIWRAKYEDDDEEIK